MDVAVHLLILIGIGCLIMGFVLLSQPHELAREETHQETETKEEETREEPNEDPRNESLKPVTRPADRIWLQETRELSEPVRPFPTF